MRPLNILFTGSGRSGSWQIRGAQLGAAVGATVLPMAVDVDDFDLVVVVKRIPPELLQRLHKAGAKFVWDIVDAWPQPVGNAWSREEALHWLRRELERVRPFAVVAATRAMAEDVRSVSPDLLVFSLPHHARPGISLNPVRTEIAAIGYEGGEAYIAGWRGAIERECDARGWRFVLNPASLAELDVVLALRDATGYAPRHWKSNVKLANAQASATPFIGVAERGYTETALVGCERFVETPRELAVALDALRPHNERSRVSSWMRAVAPLLPAVAGDYKLWLAECAKTAQRS